MAARMDVTQVDDLYGLPLDRFVARRGALSRALRRDGQREQAAAVAGLRKPSVAAWAVNQLARTQAQALADLFAAGEELRDVQSEVLAGREDPPALRAAADQERASVDALIDLARGLLDSEGHELSATVLDRVAETLNAAALDDDARATVREGRLERELRHVGLGTGAPAQLGTPTRTKHSGQRPGRRAGKERAGKGRAGDGKPGQPTGAEEPRTQVAQQRAGGAPSQRADPATQRADAKRAERERADARRAARVAEAQARREADRAERALNIARERRERAAQALDDADQALAQAESQAREASDAHRRAREELDRL